MSEYYDDLETRGGDERGARRSTPPGLRKRFQGKRFGKDSKRPPHLRRRPDDERR